MPSLARFQVGNGDGQTDMNHIHDSDHSQITLAKNARTTSTCPRGTLGRVATGALRSFRWLVEQNAAWNPRA